MASNTAPPAEPKKRQRYVFAVFYALAFLMGLVAIYGPINGTPDAFGPGAVSCLGLLVVGWILQRLKV